MVHDGQKSTRRLIFQSRHSRPIPWQQITAPPLAASQVSRAGHWVPGWDYALAPDGTALTDSGYMGIAATFNFLPHAYFGPAHLVAHYAPAETIHIDEEALLVSGPPDNNIGHWMIDFLTRLQGRALCPSRKLKIVVPDNLGRKFHDMLALFGISADDTIRCTKGKRYSFRMLHVYQPGRSMPPHPKHVAFLRQGFRGAAKVQPNQGKRIFLSRAGVGKRMIANADEFTTVLRDEGFQSVDMATLSIARQKELFADAAVIIGTMGTDLLALYLAPLTCTVIGIIDDPAQDPLIRQTCAHFGMPFQYLLSRTTGASTEARHIRDVDFIVDCAELRRRLREIAARA